MRFLLALALFGVFSFLGFSKAKALKRRLNVVEGFAVDIRQLSILMRYKMIPVRELIQKLEGSALKDFWETLLNEMERARPLADAWRDALEKVRDGGGDFFYMADEEARVIGDFGAALGTSDLAAQRANMELALERLQAQASALGREASQKGKVFRSLGMLGGLAAAIVIW
ncbi:MAG: stage III sporulation protein AB [Clostridiaceae bacterium]|nr:stage III sporulation protein AB [Eubacteriales bacterium]